MKQTWLADIESRADSIPYGQLEVIVTRINRHTTKVTTVQNETLRYNDNSQAAKDIIDFLSGLVDAGHTGKVQFEVSLKEGQINLLGITNTEEKQYGQQKR
jgi:hypothetical protein